MDVFLNKIENTITQLSTLANSETLSEKDQHLVDNSIPILLKDMLYFINGDIIPKLDTKALNFIKIEHKSLELRHIRTNSDQQKQVLSDILIKTIDLILKTVPVYCNFERKQEEYWTLYRLPGDDFIGNFLRSLDRFYIGWIQSFQNKPKTRENFIAISGVFCLSIKNGVMYECSNREETNQLTKMYKSFTSKLALFNADNELPLVLDPTFFPKVRYHSTPNKKPSLCLVGYQKAYFINANLEMDMSFEEKRASDCCTLEGSSIHGSRMMIVSKSVEMVVSSIELGFKTVILELPEFSPFFESMNITILKEKVKDPYEVINSFNFTSFPIIDSKICDERMIYSTMMVNRLMDCSSDMIMN